MIIYAGVRERLGAQRLLSKSSIFRANFALGYGFSLCAFGIALALRFLIEDSLPPGFPFLTFFPAVIISAFIAGSGPGLLCNALSLLAAWYWFLDGPRPLAIADGGAIALAFFALISAVDILLIRAAARSIDQLAAKRAQLNAIVETVPLGILVADLPSGQIIGRNIYAEQMLGCPLLKATDISDLGELISFPEASATSNKKNLFADNLLRGEQDVSFEVQYQRADGSRAWARLLARPVREERGRASGAVIALVDIDEDHNNRIALEEALKAKELLLYEVNHRVKNSLQLVNSFLFLEAMKFEGSVAHSAIMSARDKVDIIARVHQLLYESGTHSSVNMADITEDVVRDLLLTAGRGEVDLYFIFSGNLMLDIRQAIPLILVLNEIVTNAIKYGLSARQPKLSCYLDDTGEVITLKLVDNGPGMARKDYDGGAGLGSQIIKGLVHQMRGEIVTQNLEPGMTTVLTIPTKH
jgi:PAS domain S-box-containing protein